MGREFDGFFDRGPFQISSRALGAFIAAYLFGQFFLSSLLYFDPFTISVFFMGTATLALVMGTARFLRRENGISSFVLGWVQPAYGWYLAALAGVFVAHLLAGLFWLRASPDAIEQITEYNAQLAPAAGGVEPFFSFLAICLVYPILEEILFRGALQTYLMERFGLVIAVLASALIFGLAHSGAINALGGVMDQLLAVCSLACVGIVASLLRHFSGSLYPAIAMHAGYNAALFIYAAALP